MEEINTPQLAEIETISSRSATALRELEERARSTLSAQKGQIAQLETDISKQLDAIAASIAEARASESQDASQASESQAELERLRQEAAAAQIAHQQEKAAQDAELNTVRAELNTVRAELQALSTKLAEQERQLAESTSARTALAAERDELLKKVADFESRREKDKQQSQTELDDFEKKFQAQQASWNEQRTAWEKSSAEMTRQRDELQQKFELALVDVQRFRGRVAELEQELARRPETNQADSAELVALRAERDALAQRIEELEQQPAPVAVDADEQMSDLQRRFELAVEDVRELKTKNAELEARLASKKVSHADGGGGGSDWESMKKRLLASLEEATDDSDNPLPEKERITISDTIEMTDAVVADKDREIEQLKAQLAEASENSKVAEADHQQQEINELLDGDAIIAEHRQRIALLEREMEDKLRAAELELSVERAKIAREKVELEDLRVEVESRRPAAAVNTAAPAQPRRRWLSKLGISSDEQ
jgi:DNA repair exonuclease SbcCD ATPase subunit